MAEYILQVGAYICTDISVFEQIINLITGQHEDAILGAYIIPRAMLTFDTSQPLVRWAGQSSYNTVTKTYYKPSSINGYTPVNKKLLTFPYCFINVSNNNGSSNSLHYEDFHDPQNEGQIYFLIKGVPVPRWIY